MRPLTTPTHYFELPVSAEQVKAVEVIYKNAENGATLLHKRKTDFRFEGNTVILELTQADTKVFAGCNRVMIQLRVLTDADKVPMSDIWQVPVGKCLFSEELKA